MSFWARRSTCSGHARGQRIRSSGCNRQKKNRSEGPSGQDDTPHLGGYRPPLANHSHATTISRLVVVAVTLTTTTSTAMISRLVMVAVSGFITISRLVVVAPSSGHGNMAAPSPFNSCGSSFKERDVCDCDVCCLSQTAKHSVVGVSNFDRRD